MGYAKSSFTITAGNYRSITSEIGRAAVAQVAAIWRPQIGIKPICYTFRRMASSGRATGRHQRYLKVFKCCIPTLKNSFQNQRLRAKGRLAGLMG